VRLYELRGLVVVVFTSTDESETWSSNGVTVEAALTVMRNHFDGMGQAKLQEAEKLSQLAEELFMSAGSIESFV